jgi:hypothetical protein
MVAQPMRSVNEPRALCERAESCRDLALIGKKYKGEVLVRFSEKRPYPARI